MVVAWQRVKGQLKRIHVTIITLPTFRLEHEDDYEYEF